MANLIIGCNYHTKWQSDKAMRFVLVEIQGTRARLQTRRTGKDFWTDVSDLIFIETKYNRAKKQRLIDEQFDPNKGFKTVAKKPTEKQMEYIESIESNTGVLFTGSTKEEAAEYITANKNHPGNENEWAIVNGY